MIAGAVKETFSAIILFISALNKDLRLAGSFATITSGVPPAFAASLKFFRPQLLIPPP